MHLKGWAKKLIPKLRSMQYRTCPEKPTLLTHFSLYTLFWEKKLRGQHFLLVQIKESTDLSKGSSSSLLTVTEGIRSTAPRTVPPAQSSHSRSSCKCLQHCCCGSEPPDLPDLLRRRQLRNTDPRSACSSASRGTPLLHSSESENKRCSCLSLYFCSEQDGCAHLRICTFLSPLFLAIE